MSRMTDFIQVPVRILAKFWVVMSNGVEYGAGSSGQGQTDMSGKVNGYLLMHDLGQGGESQGVILL